jgi:hypothetical protein
LQPHVGATVKQPAAAIDFAVGNDTLAGILEESAEEIQSLTAALLA